MSNEAIYVYANEVVLEASGASAASNAFVAADDTSLSSANHSNYPDADIILNCSLGAAPAAGTVISLYRQDMQVDDASNDSEAPSTEYPHKFVGVFAIKSGQSAEATYTCSDVPLSRICQFSIKNETAQNLDSGWTLKAKPKTLGPAA